MKTITALALTLALALPGCTAPDQVRITAGDPLKITVEVDFATITPTDPTTKDAAKKTILLPHGTYTLRADDGPLQTNPKQP